MDKGDNGKQEQSGKPKRRRVVDPNAQLIRDIDRIVAARMKPLEQHLSNLEGTVDVQGRQTARLMQNAGMRDADIQVTDKGAGVNADQTWVCTKCGCRLGHYDPNREIVRTAKGQHVVWIHVGVGGWAKTICPMCKEEGWVHYTPDGDTTESPMNGNEVVLDVDLLEALLAEAHTSEHGYAKLRLFEVEDVPR